MAYADTRAPVETGIELFEIEQLVAPGEVAPRPMLPSLRYHPAPGELADRDLTLPWTLADPAGVHPLVVGELARELGSRVPGRLVASAKSWLSHTEVDRTAAILPWGAVGDATRVSPVDASACYLAYVRDAWNHRFPRNRLEKQEVVLTVPASFDEAARALTVEAARTAGLARCRLLEEPQAACYDWIHRHRDALAEELAGVRLLLVIDVGGGTTDLTLIRVSVPGNEPELTRIGVGDHLMLGGDNMDLALAHLLEQRLGGARLSAAALSQLLQQCRSAKERLLTPDAPAHTKVTVLGSGARLVGGARSAELTRDEVGAMIVDGFFPEVAIDERPHGRRSAIVEFGLPYAPDAAVTRHLASFLGHHARVSGEALDEGKSGVAGTPVPDAVLLNGGVFHSETLTDRLLGVLESWRGGALVRLHNADPALAVARGAVAYAMARQGKNLRIGGGSARTYFLIVSEEGEHRQGVCLLPRGSEEGREVRLTERTFSLRLGEPVGFHLASSTGDNLRRPGDLIDLDGEGAILLPPVATVLGTGEETGEVPVQLGFTPTEVGTLDMGCVAVDDSQRRWDLSFQLRRKGAAQLEETSHPRFEEAAGLIGRLYGTRTRNVDPKEIRGLRNNLERILGRRKDWDTGLLRQLYGELWEGGRRRRRSAHHERFWFSLTGYCLRPGFGYPLDDWRVRQLWSLHAQGVQFANEAQNWAEWWTMWRRVAGGLEEVAQVGLLDDVAGELARAGGKSKKATRATRSLSQGDMLRLVGSLERLPVERKVAVGDGLVGRLKRKGEPTQTWWTIGRLGARIPLYGSLHGVVPQETAERWLEKALAGDWKKNRDAAFAATMLARMSGDRERDLDPKLQQRVVKVLRDARAPVSWVRMVSQVVELDAADEQQVFGESLPPGLRLVS
ncbi:MAG: Hsp70 family protein [Pseudomonadota bacterium]|nr:Hsp70 family protein [Pseudomonadota bacterium]